MDRFILLVPKTWNTMLRADQTTAYNCMESLNPVHIIQENKSIPKFFFEYFMQEKMDNLLDIALEKTCFFEFTETDGVGMIHCLIEMYRIRKANFS